MAPTLYFMHESSASRAALITAKAIGLKLIEREINLFDGEQLTPEFIGINPQHTLPTFVDDDGFTLWDSHAIMVYMVSKYAKNDNLYPKDFKKKAIVDQRLHFDSGVANLTLRKAVVPIYSNSKHAVYEEDKEEANDVYDLLETFLEGRQWVAGDSVTIADYSISISVIGLNILVPVDSIKFPKVVDWIKRCEELPEYQANVRGLQLVQKMLKTKLA